MSSTALDNVLHSTLYPHEFRIYHGLQLKLATALYMFEAEIILTFAFSFHLSLPSSQRSSHARFYL